MLASRSGDCGAEAEERVRRRVVGLLAEALIGSALLFAFASLATAQVDVREEEDFANSAFVPVSEEARAELFVARKRVEDGDAAAAIEACQRLIEQRGGALVEWSGRVLLSGERAARLLLLSLPEEAKNRYRELFGARAEAAWRAARRRADRAALLRTARRFPLCRAAGRAARDAALLALESADGAGALSALRLLDELGATRPGDLALAIEAAAIAADVGRVRALAEKAAEQPDVRVRVEGEEVALLAQARSVLAALGGDRPGPDPGAPWRVRLLARLPPDERQAVPKPSGDPLGDRVLAFPPLGFVRVDDALFVTGRLGLLRLDPNAAGLQRVLPGERYGTRFESREPATRRLDAARDGERFYFVVSERERTFFGPGEESSHLVAVDARRPERPLWTVDPEAPGASDALQGYVFEGPPVCWRGRVVVLGSRLDTDTTCALFVFDGADGRFVDRIVLATAAKVPRYEARNRRTEAERAAPAPPLVRDGWAFCLTNLGVVAAVDLERGVVEWAFRYHRIQPLDPDAYSPQAFYDTGGWAPAPPRSAGDEIVVAPEDSRFLYVLSARPSARGLLLTRDPVFKGPRDAWIGVDLKRHALLFLQRDTIGPTRTRYRVSATGFDGEWLWESAPLAPEEDVTGRPLPLGDLLLVPTGRALYRFRLDQQGRAFDAVVAPPELVGDAATKAFGNLFLDDHGLVSVSEAFVLSIEARR